MPVGVSAYVPLATKTLTATATSVTFSSISQAYRDLVLVVNIPTGALPSVRFNSDSGSNYSSVFMIGTGSIASSGVASNATSIQDQYIGSGPSIWTLNIFDYSATNKHKSIVWRSDKATDYVQAYATRWASTAAITTINLPVAGTNFAIGSTFTLYGIAA